MADEIEPIYKGRKINSLTDEELVAVSFELSGLLDKVALQRADPRFVQRLRKIGKTDKGLPAKVSLPPINPAIAELQNHINNEIEKRKG